MEDITQTPQPAARPSARNQLAIPVAIVIGFALIAVAIYLSGGLMAKNQPAANLGQNNGTETEPVAGPIRPVDETDHVRGNPNAPIVIVEYSDYDCPFCKNFHETMKQVMDNYGASGQVAWVYRHMPIEQLHPSAPRIAAAAECVADLAGNDAFWTFSDLVFGERDTNEPTNVTRLTEFATTAGANAAAFEDCLESGRMAPAVAEDLADAASAGARGTPHSIVLVGDQRGTINGAQSYSTVSQIIETLLEQTAGQPAEL